MIDSRARIVEAAADLLTRAGRDAVSTRAVSAAAGVQAPAIYRQFGDMRAVLHAAAREVLARYVREKQAHKPAKDPLDELRRGWDMHIAFGLANPAAYTLMYADAEATHSSEEARAGYAVLEEKVARLAEAGRLRVSVAHAARMIHAAGCGVVLSLIATPPEERDLRVSESMREAVYAAIMTPSTSKPVSGSGLAAHAVALRAALAEARDVLSAAERQLLGEWLDRLSRPRP